MTRAPTQPPAIAPPAPPAAPALGQRAARGFAWVVAQTVANKAVGLGAQVALAWLLVPEEFGLVSLALTVTTLVNVVQQGGVREVLIQRSRHLRRWSNAAAWMSLATGILGAAIVLLAAPLAAWAYEEPRLTGLLAVGAFSLLLNPLPLVPMAHLQSQLRFRLLSSLEVAEATAVAILSIAFALMGLGAYSLLLPRPIVNLLRGAIVWHVVRPPLRAHPQLRRWRYMIGDTSRALIARACTTLIAQGDRMVLGLLHASAVVGLYHFAFNLSMQTVLLFGYGLEGVLFPAFSKLQDDRQRQLNAFLSAARLLALIAVPLSLLQAGLADPLISAVFEPKWHGSIPAIQILSIGMAIRVVAWPARGLLQAQGRFAVYMTISACGSALFMLIVLLGSWLGTGDTAAITVAAAVSMYFAVEAPISLYIAIRSAGGRWLDILRIYMVPLAAGTGAVLLGMGLASLCPPMPLRDPLRMGIITLVSVCLYLPIVRLLAPQPCHDLLTRLRSLRPSSTASRETH